eukprot:12430870-Karenia_brevis.AAC.1
MSVDKNWHDNKPPVFRTIQECLGTLRRPHGATPNLASGSIEGPQRGLLVKIVGWDSWPKAECIKEVIKKSGGQYRDISAKLDPDGHGTRGARVQDVQWRLSAGLEMHH